MNILVCVKHVPDTEMRVKMAPDGLHLDLSEATFIMNPYDAFALEQALQLKETFGGEVTVLTLGGDDATKTLRQALAMGADKAVLISDAIFEGNDALATAKTLAAAARKHPFDLILTGKQGMGEDNQQIGSLLAQLLDLPAITVVTQMEQQGNEVTCTRQIEGGAEIVKTSLPAVLTCHKGLNEPRYPSLKGIMLARRKEVARYGAADLSLDGACVGIDAATFELKKVELPPPRPAGKILAGEIQDQVKQLVQLLHKEAMAI